jgi:hypothetical protein
MARLAARLAWAFGVGALAMSTAACSPDTGHEDCVESCQQEFGCVGMSTAVDTCQARCDSEEQQADDQGCYGEWEEYQACRVETDACDAARCSAERSEWQDCGLDYCRNHPDDWDYCHVDSVS